MAAKITNLAPGHRMFMRGLQARAESNRSVMCRKRHDGPNNVQTQRSTFSGIGFSMKIF